MQLCRKGIHSSRQIHALCGPSVLRTWRRPYGQSNELHRFMQAPAMERPYLSRATFLTGNTPTILHPIPRSSPIFDSFYAGKVLFWF